MSKKYIIMKNLNDNYDDQQNFMCVVYDAKNVSEQMFKYPGYCLIPFNKLKTVITQDTQDHPFTFDSKLDAIHMAEELVVDHFHIKKVCIPFKEN